MKMKHTYIIVYYNPSVRIKDLVSHTTYIVCANFIQFIVVSERQTYDGNFISLSVFLPEICWEEVADEIFFHSYVLMSNLWFESKLHVYL